MEIQQAKRTVLGVIPARMESERLPGKPLRLISGHPMIAWVYRRALECRALDRLLVATDSEQIAVYCGKTEIPFMMTSRAHRSGTDRIIEVMATQPAQIYVNIQGDEPMVTADHIERLLKPFGERSDTQVTTLAVRIASEEAGDPNAVKVVLDASGRALYFSRAPIPYDRDGSGGARYYKHLGLYAYASEALAKFSRLAPSPLEQTEKLEQLRFLENGIPIVVSETGAETIGVDTEDDLKRVEEGFRRAGARLPGS